MPAGHYIAFKNLPMFPLACTDTELANKRIFTTLVRIAAPFNKMAEGIGQMFRHYSWTRFSMFIRDFGICLYGAQGLVEIFKGTNVTIMDWVKADRVVTDDVIERALGVIRDRARSRLNELYIFVN